MDCAGESLLQLRYLWTFVRSIPVIKLFRMSFVGVVEFKRSQTVEFKAIIFFRLPTVKVNHTQSHSSAEELHQMLAESVQMMTSTLRDSWEEPAWWQRRRQLSSVKMHHDVAMKKYIYHYPKRALEQNCCLPLPYIHCLITNVALTTEIAI